MVAGAVSIQIEVVPATAAMRSSVSGLMSSMSATGLKSGSAAGEARRSRWSEISLAHASRSDGVGIR